MFANVPAAQADILQPNQNGGFAMFLGPFGQTFTAETTDLVSITVNYSDVNEAQGSAATTIDLFAGSGYGGTLLDSVTLDLAGKAGLQTFVFGDVLTTIGSLYTFRLSAASGRGLAWLWLHDDGTAGGIGRLQTGRKSSSAYDLRFSIDDSLDPIPPTVPEPTSLVLLATGVLGLIARRRAVA